eukprot:gene6090-12295_t
MINSSNNNSKVADFRYLNNLSSTLRETEKIAAKKRSSTRVYCIGLGFCLCIIFLAINFIRYDFLNFSWNVSEGLTNCESNFPHPSCKLELPRALQYCAEVIYGGREGRFPNDDQWTLKQLTLVIRHGDRSSIHRLPNATPVIEKRSSPYINPEALRYISRLDSFTLKLLSKGTVNDCLNKSTIFQGMNEFHPSAPGILTTSGFMQHIHQGNWLRLAYSDFLHGITSVRSVYVRSTNYDRTIQ